MHITYFHFLRDSDTAMNHVAQFVGAAQELGHTIQPVPMNASNKRADSRPSTLWRRVRPTLKSHFSRFLHEPKELLANVPTWRTQYGLLRRNRPDAVLVRNQFLDFSTIVPETTRKLLGNYYRNWRFSNICMTFSQCAARTATCISFLPGILRRNRICEWK